MNRRCMTVGLGVAALLLAFACYADECKAPQGLSVSDKKAIQSLARNLGLGKPARICQTVVGLPTGCPAFRVDAAPLIEGRWRTWQSLWIADSRDASSGECPFLRQESVPLRKGRWSAQRENVHSVRTWRIVDSDGFVDVSLGDGVTTAIAEQLIRAVRLGALVDKRTSPMALEMGEGWLRELRRRFADGRASVVKSYLDPDAYEVQAVSGGSWPIMVLRIAGNKVQWLDAMFAIS